MKIRFWGTRGSFAMSGRNFLRYGGNTTCVELLDNRGDRLVIDLGTGATELAKQLMKTELGKGKGRLNVLLSHTHLDHIVALTFLTDTLASCGDAVSFTVTGIVSCSTGRVTW